MVSYDFSIKSYTYLHVGSFCDLGNSAKVVWYSIFHFVQHSWMTFLDRWCSDDMWEHETTWGGEDYYVVDVLCLLRGGCSGGL